MTTKLTLTIEDEVIEKAKTYAKHRGHSLSNIVENYLKSVINETKINKTELTPIVKSLKGSFKAPAEFNYKKELSKGLIKKYL